MKHHHHVYEKHVRRSRWKSAALIFVLLPALVLCTVAAADEADGKVVAAARAAAPIVLDGKLDEACWQAAPVAEEFLTLRSGDPAEAQTSFRVLWDDEYVYVGIHAEEPHMDRVRAAAAERTGEFTYRLGQTIEVFLGATGNPTDFLQIMVNTDGTMNTWMTQPLQLRNLDITPAVHLADDSFSMEIAIPFAALHIGPDAGQTWGMNICRARMTQGQPSEVSPDVIYSSWRHSPGGFRRPERFGKLEIAAAISPFQLQVTPEVDHDRLHLAIVNHTGASRELTLEADMGEAGTFREALALAAGDERVVTVPVASPDRFQADVVLRDTDGTVRYRGGMAQAEISPAATGTTPATDEDYVVFTMPYMQRGNHLTIPRPEQINRPLEIFTTPGEFEPATFAVRPQQALEGVVVRLAGTLRGPEGATIPGEAVTIRAVERMQRWLSPVEFEQVECFLPRTERRDLPANITQRYWLTVAIPPDTPAGVYEGRIRIGPQNAPAQLLPLRVEVAPVRLAPAEGVNYFMYHRPTYFPEELRTEEFFAMCLEDMRDHGMNSVTLYAYPSGPGWVDVERDNIGEVPMARHIEMMQETGLLAPWSKIIWIGAEVYGADAWRPVQRAAKERQWPELLFYIVDEPTHGRYELVDRVMERVAAFRAEHPDLAFRTTTAGAEDPRVSDYYDIWITASGVEMETLERGLQEGKELWSYECGLAPVDAHTSRYYFGLYTWKTGITGVSHWAYFDRSMRNRFMVNGPWRNSVADLREYTHRFNYVYPTPDELIPSIGWEAVREGITDYRYLLTLKRTVETAQAEGATEAEVRPALALLAEVDRLVHPESIREEIARGKALEEETRRAAIRDFERKPPQPEITAEKYEELRRRIAAQITALNRAGYIYRPPFQQPFRQSFAPSASATDMTMAADAAPVGEAGEMETLWETCDDIDKRNTTYAQPYWRPKAFEETRIGTLEVCPDEKLVGNGSIRWHVTREDLDAQLAKTPEFSHITLHYLYGRDWEPYTELRFHLKCKSPQHPPVYAMLIGAKAPYRQVLTRNEMTEGWKEIRWDLREADIGVSERYGKIMNYFRLFSTVEDFNEDDELELYLDNMRLVTAAPTDVTTAFD